MVDYNSHQLLWVRADKTVFSPAGLADGVWRDGTLTMHPDASTTHWVMGPHPATKIHRHWMIESVVLQMYDDSDDVDNVATDWILAFWSAAARLPADIDANPYLAHMLFDTSAAQVTLGTAAGNVTYYGWEDHDVKLPYVITDTPTSGYSALYLSFKPSGAALGAIDDITLLFGMRPLHYS